MNAKTKKTLIVALAALVLLVAAFVCVRFIMKPDTDAGLKTISVEVVMPDGASKTHAIETSEEYLKGALEQEELIEGEQQAAGFMVTTVDGYYADPGAGEWWVYTFANGDYVTTGVAETPIADGDGYIFSVYKAA